MPKEIALYKLFNGNIKEEKYTSTNCKYGGCMKPIISVFKIKFRLRFNKPLLLLYCEKTDENTKGVLVPSVGPLSGTFRPKQALHLA